MKRAVNVASFGEAILFVVMGIFAVMALALFAQAEGRDVPDSAKREIARRGSMAEHVGTVRNGLFCQALATPEDDSGKWYLTLIVKKGDAKSDAMRTMIAQNQAIRAWVDVANPKQSFTHFQEKSVDDQTQRDWLAPMQPAIAEFGLPALVLQPPRNGKFGDSSRVVKTIHGVRTGEDLDERLREAVKVYCESIDHPIQIGQASAENPMAVAPPFNVQPTPDAAPSPPSTPLPGGEWPQSKPKKLSIKRLRELCPGASPEFLRDQYQKGYTDEDAVELEWMIEQGKLKPPPLDQLVPMRPETTPAENVKPNPTLPATTGPTSLLVAQWVPAAVISIWCLLMIWERITKRNGDALKSERDWPIDAAALERLKTEYFGQYQVNEKPNETSVRKGWRPDGSRSNGNGPAASNSEPNV